MAYTKTITDANTYFGTDNHVRAYDWANYSTAERTAALAQAKREIEISLNRTAEDPYASARYRDDYAIFEQALFLLDQTVRTSNSENSAQRIETVDSEERDTTRGVAISPQAQRYLGLTRIKIING